MSSSEVVNTSCPHCGKEYPVTLWNSVSTSFSATVAKDMISGKFFLVTCPHCGENKMLEYPVLYNDVLHNTLVWIVYRGDSYEETLKYVRETTVPSTMSSLLANSVSEFRQIVSALEAGRDSRLVELCKIYIEAEISEQIPDFRPAEVYYEFMDDQEVLIITGEDDSCLQCDFPYDIYEMYEKAYGAVLAKEPKTPYPLYNRDWAIDFVMNHVPGEE